MRAGGETCGLLVPKSVAEMAGANRGGGEMNRVGAGGVFGSIVGGLFKDKMAAARPSSVKPSRKSCSLASRCFPRRSRGPRGQARHAPLEHRRPGCALATHPEGRDGEASRVGLQEAAAECSRRTATRAGSAQRRGPAGGERDHGPAGRGPHRDRPDPRGDGEGSEVVTTRRAPGAESTAGACCPTLP